MGEDGRQIDDAGRLVDGGGLHRGDFVLAERLARDFEPAGERRIAKLPCTPLPSLWLDRPGQRLLRIGEFGLRLSQRRGERRDRCTRPLHGRPPRSKGQS